MRKTQSPHRHTKKHSHAHGHGHDHDHGHSHSHHVDLDEGKAPRSLVIAIVVTVIFMVVEIIGGWIANSLALLSDGAHMLTDVGGMLLSLFVIWVARRPYSKKMSFGYHRAEIIGALFSGLAIWSIAGLLVYQAFVRLTDPPEVQGKMVFVVAVLGLLANLFSMKALHGTKEENINVRGAYLHLLTDALGSVAAIISGLVIWLTDWRLIDPLITVVFSVLMLTSSWHLLKEAFSVLMESVPPWIDLAKVKEELSAIPEVSEVHDLHIWAVSTGRLALSVHLISKSHQRVLTAANEMLKDKYGIFHTTIQIEDSEHFRQEGCYDCNLPS